MKPIVIENYLKDLGWLRAAIEYGTLATACQLTLEGRGPPDIQDQCIATICWQAATIERVGRLLEHLAEQGLITDIFDEEIADRTLWDHPDNVYIVTLWDRLEDDAQRCLMSPPNEGHVDVQFNDACSWLIGILAYNWLTYPDKFNLDRVMNEVLAFLA